MASTLDSFPATEPRLVYERLPTPRTIRLFVLARGEPGDPIKGDLIWSTVTGGKVSYMALSYAWGDSTLSRSIECDQCRVGVTENLYSLLSRMRHPDSIGIYWVDALCINQSTDPAGLQERSQQVQMMAEIFSGAMMVMIDLKHPIDDPDSFFDFVGRFSEATAEVWIDKEHTTARVKALRLPDLEDPRWQVVSEFINRPWFSRVWMLQEYTLAKEPNFLFSRFAAPAQPLLRCLVLACYHALWLGQQAQLQKQSVWTKAMATNRLLLPSIGARVPLLNRFDIGRDTRESTSPDALAQCFFDNIFNNSTFGATDPRDRIYAVLGMWPSEKAKSMAVDYTETRDLLERRAFRWLYAVGAGSRLLYRCVGMGTKSTRSSWAFNLDTNDDWLDNRALNFGIGAKSQKLYNACGNTLFDLAPEPSPMSIRTQAYLLGRIGTFGPQGPYQGSWSQHAYLTSYDDERGQQAFAWHQEITRWIAAILDQLDPALKARDVWITLVADSVDRQRLSKNTSLQKSLDAFLELLNKETARKATQSPILSHPVARAIDDTINSPSFMDGIITRVIEDLKISPQLATPVRLGMADAANTLFQEATPYTECLPNLGNKRLAVSDTGLLCMVPSNSVNDGRDHLCIISGAPIPFVLRQDGHHYRMVGSCYIHNMMDGQWFDQNPIPESQEIEIY